MSISPEDRELNEVLEAAFDGGGACARRVADYIEKLQAQLPRWIPVAERLPEPGEEVLVFIDGHRGPAWKNNYSLVAYLGASVTPGCWLQERHPDADPIVGVTHWMPLPAPPAS
jgi:hypothetical protein